jgi:hypothetical protein
MILELQAKQGEKIERFVRRDQIGGVPSTNRQSDKRQRNGN